MTTTSKSILARLWRFIGNNDKQVSITVDFAGFFLTIVAILISATSIHSQISSNHQQNTQQQLRKAETEMEKIYQHKQSMNRIILSDDDIRRKLGSELEEFDIYNFYLFNDYEKILALECQGLFSSTGTYLNAQLMIKVTTDPSTPTGQWFNDKILALARVGRSPYPVGLIRYIMDLRKLELRDARLFPLVDTYDTSSTNNLNGSSTRPILPADLYTDHNDLGKDVKRNNAGNPMSNPGRYCFVSKNDLLRDLR